MGPCVPVVCTAVQDAGKGASFGGKRPSGFYDNRMECSPFEFKLALQIESFMALRD
jgi:hypothetical protein